MKKLILVALLGFMSGSFALAATGPSDSACTAVKICTASPNSTDCKNAQAAQGQVLDANGHPVGTAK